MQDAQKIETFFADFLNFYSNTELKVYQVFFFLVALLVLYSYHRKDRLSLVYTKGSKFKNFVQKTQMDQLEFKPYFLGFNRFFQNLCFICVDSYRYRVLKAETQVEREVCTLEDGGQIALDWVLDENGGKPEKDSQQPILLMLSGLAGGKENLYNVDVIDKAKKSGFKAVLMSHRGTCGMKLTTSKFYDALSFDDLHEVTEYVFKTYCEKQNRKLHGYGVSLGAHIFTLHLIEREKKSRYTSVATNCNLYDFKSSTQYFKDEAFYGFSCWLFGQNMKSLFTEQLPELKKFLSSEKYELLKKNNEKVFDLLDYDTLVTVPMRGLKSIDEYHDLAYAKDKLHKIETPMFNLQSEDDFVVSPDILPRKHEAPNVMLAITKCGSHCCFVSGDVTPDLWVGNVFMKFFNYY